MESGGGGGGAGFVAGRSSDEEPTPTPTSTSTLLGRMRLALSRRTSSASKPGGSNKQTPLGSRRGSAISEPEPEVDFLGTSVRAKKASSSTSMTTTTTTNNPNAGLSLSQLFAEKRPFDPSVPLSETGRGSRPGDGAIEFGFSLSRGRRLVMEDFHAARFETHPSVPGKDTVGTFGVFDGHGGDRAAAFVSRELFRSILSSEEFASGDAAGALTAGFLATDRAYLLAEDEESLAAAAAAAEEEEAARKKKVFGKVKSIFNKSRNISGEMTANGSGSGNNDFGLSPPPASSMMAATLSGAPSSSSMSSGEGSGHGRGGTGAGTGGGIKINGRGGGLTTTTTTTRSSSAASPPLTPTEGDLARSTSGTGGTGGAGAGAGAGTGGNSSPSPFPLTPSPSRQRPPARDDGCTAAVALVLGDERLLVAHVGDSRAVLVEPVAAGAAAPEAGKTKKREGSWRGGKKNEASSTPPPPPLPPTSSPPPPLPPFTARALSADHKPNRPDERARIEAAGGAVLWAGTWRVGGVLAVSRAFGDSALKLTSGVVAEPDVHEERLNLSSTSFSSASSSFAPLLILATDGVWDALGNDEAAAVALAHAGDLEAAARALTREAWERGSPDNATAVVVRLGPKGAATSEAAAA